MVVPAITDLDLDTFDEKKDSQVNAKCYLTFATGLFIHAIKCFTWLS